MSDQEQQGDGGLYTTPDVYETQSGQDIYRTPDTAGGAGGIFSGEQQTVQVSGDAENVQYDNNACGSDAYGNGQDADGPCEIVKYEEQPLNDRNENASGEGDPYRNVSYENAPYGAGSCQNGQYGNMPYGSGPYQNGQYTNVPYGSGPYQNGQYGTAPYGSD